jgi:hypothetical protein
MAFSYTLEEDHIIIIIIMYESDIKVIAIDNSDLGFQAYITRKDIEARLILTTGDMMTTIITLATTVIYQI